MPVEIGTVSFGIMDWITITTALLAALSPIYYFMWSMNMIITTNAAIIANCPYCNRRDRTEN